MHDLLEGVPVSLVDMIAEAKRELHMRRSVYPRRVANAKMSQGEMDRAIRVQQAIIDALTGMEALKHAQ